MKNQTARHLHSSRWHQSLSDSIIHLPIGNKADDVPTEAEEEQFCFHAFLQTCAIEEQLQQLRPGDATDQELSVALEPQRQSDFALKQPRLQQSHLHLHQL